VGKIKKLGWSAGGERAARYLAVKDLVKIPFHSDPRPSRKKLREYPGMVTP